MAKVKDQVYDGSEVSYIDATGETHYIGEFIRQAMTDAYPLYTLNPTGVVRKSPRSKKPTEAGPGSGAQAPIRECWQQCTDRWNNMPDDCTGRQPCFSQSSKQNVWAAKQSQGVMCSYFDLFMAACMSTCSAIGITGPDGNEIQFGTIPESDQNWPCAPNAEDSEIGIHFDTNTMQPGATQTLTAIDPATGDPANYGDPALTNWNTMNDNGLEDLGPGPSVDYVAPLTNPNCENNVSIFVVDECGRSAYIDIATNVYPGGTAAYYDDDAAPDIHCNVGTMICIGWVYWWRHKYDCNGNLLSALDKPYHESPEFYGNITEELPGCEGCMLMIASWMESNPPPSPQNGDIRTSGMTAAGCCPGALF